MSPEYPSPPECQVAFKEWAVVCAALAAGRQTIILRKGGIHEGRAGFRVDHRHFWLFPTGFHQESASLVTEAVPLLAEILRDRPPENVVRLSHWAAVETVHELHDESAALRLVGKHIWSEATVRQRFHYRTPGLFLLVVRVFAAPHAVELPLSDYFAGCKSWVDLPAPLSFAGAAPVLSETEYNEMAVRVAATIEE